MEASSLPRALPPLTDALHWDLRGARSFQVGVTDLAQLSADGRWLLFRNTDGTVLLLGKH